MWARFLPIKHYESYEDYARLNEGAKMSTEYLSDDIVLVTLPLHEPQIADELKSINNIVSEKGICNVIIDFSGVEVMTSSSVSNLIILHQLLDGQNRKLILCNVAFVTKCIFTVAGLEHLFHFAEDTSAALSAVSGETSSLSATNHNKQ